MFTGGPLRPAWTLRAAIRRVHDHPMFGLVRRPPPLGRIALVWIGRGGIVVCHRPGPSRRQDGSVPAAGSKRTESQLRFPGNGLQRWSNLTHSRIGRRRSMRHQHRHRHVPQQVPRYPAHDHFPGPRMPISAHHQKIRPQIGSIVEQRIGGRQTVGHHGSRG
jgi:hypothetical protein